MQLTSNIKGKTKIGYLVSADRSGRFVYARAGEVPIGVITESVTRGELCEIQTTGEALVYVYGSIRANETVRSPETDEGVPAGTAVPLGDKSVYTAVGQALETGKGLVRVSINLSATTSVGTSAGVPTGGATGEALVKASAADYDTTWGPVPIGDATSDGTTYGRRDGTWSQLYWRVSVGGVPGATPNQIFDGADMDFSTTTPTYMQVQWNQTGQTLEIDYVGPTDFYAGWDPSADTGDTPTRVGSAHNVNFRGGTYVTIDYQFTASGDPDHDITVEVDTTALRGHLDSYYYDFATYPSLATQTWVTNNFDNYVSWDLQTGGVTRESITSGFELDFVTTTPTYMQVQYNATDDRLEIDYVGPTTFYAGWDPSADGGDTPTRVGSTHNVNFLGGTNITTNYGFTAGGDPDHDITINFDGTSAVALTNDFSITRTGTATMTLDGNTTTLSQGTRITMVSTDTVRARGIQYENDTTVAEWWSGIGYNVGDDYVIGYDATGGQPEYSTNAIVRITPAGRVGIGVDPGYTLDVDGDARFTGDVTMEGGGAALSLKAGATDDHVYMQWYADSAAQTTRSMYMGYSSAGTVDFTIKNEFTDGDIRINPGSASGNVSLQYAASTKLTTVNTGISVTGSVLADGEIESYDTSDIRLKKVLGRLEREEAILGLMQLKTIRYKKKDKKGSRLGLIAQDVLEAFPENIKKNPENYLMVHYGKMAVPLVAGFQSHELRIRELEEELAELKEKVYGTRS